MYSRARQPFGEKKDFKKILSKKVIGSPWVQPLRKKCHATATRETENC
jgi:hypothetical protein